MILSQLSENTLVLTVTRRLCRYLTVQYDQSQLSLGRQAWRSPTILPLSTWLNLQWQQLQQPYLLLSPEQDLRLWQQIVTESRWGEQLINTDAAAKLAQQAWCYLRQWQKPLSSVQEFATIENQAFSAWVKRYQQRCEQLAVIDEVEMAEQLLKHYQTTAVAVLPDKIILTGFEDIEPQWLQLLQALKVPLRFEQPAQQATARLLAAHNATDELDTMLRWAKALHQEQPQAHIICVVPDLEQRRNEIVTATNQVFFPEALLDSEFTQNLINISGGSYLPEQPIVQAALLLLHLNSFEVESNTLSQLLNSVFIANAPQQVTQRALLDYALRDLNEPTLTWRTVANQIARYQQHSDHDYQDILSMLDRHQALLKNAPRTATLAQWQQQMLQILAVFGWPGPRNLSSKEYQAMEHWHDLLDKFANLDIENRQYSYAAALQLLQQLAAATLFQPKTEDGSIQILGLLEAAGLESDYIWVTGMTSTAWPAPANPNPFIAAHLQRQWQMPHSSAERELQFAQKLQQRLLGSCKQLIFSYPAYDDDRELQPSTLLKDITEITREQLSLATELPLAQQLRQQNQISQFQDEHGTAANADELVYGGSGIFKAQALCAFQAFARYRLGAEALPEPELHLSAAERGSLLHAALEKIWQTLGSQEKLLSKDEAELTAIVARSIDAAFSKVIANYSQKIKPRFKILEQKRLQQLLLRWLELEKQRPPFTVAAQEQKRQVTVNGLNINIKLDRIDTLEDGKQLVIDYKTGRVNIDDCADVPLLEPQLPLYYQTDATIAAVSFAEIRADKVGFQGLSLLDTGIADIDAVGDAAWQELTAQWHAELSRLADEFNRGVATVDPQSNACDYCDLDSLCRIEEHDHVASA